MKILKYLIPVLCSSLISCSNPHNMTSLNNPSKKEKHAVIISGNSGFINTRSIYLTDSILSRNNYKTHIFDEEENRKYDVRDITTKKNLENFFDTLKTNKRDLFLLYVTGHGNRDTTKNDTTSIIEMPLEKSLKPSTLEKYLSNVNALRKVLLFTQCYGGGFSRVLKKRNNITISTSFKNKASYGSSFGNYFFKSLNNRNADINNDKKISVLEAASYACEKDLLEASYHACEKDPRAPFMMGYRTELFRRSQNPLFNNTKQNKTYNQPRINYKNLDPRKVYLSKND